MTANFRDDELVVFEARGAPPLPLATSDGYVEHDGARIWYSAHGNGPPVVLLHGGMGHGGNWGHQVPALVEAGYRVVVVDSRGHGRSTRDERPYSYELMSADVLAVMDALRIPRAALVGWSDGACTALVLARSAARRVDGVLFFACNMDSSGTRELALPNPVLDRCLSRHVKDYVARSHTPDDFAPFMAAVGEMQRTQPEYSANDLAEIRVPVTILHAERDEFIKREHAEYLARSIQGAKLVVMHGVSHFAPLQRPEQFNGVVLDFLHPLLLGRPSRGSAA